MVTGMFTPLLEIEGKQSESYLRSPSPSPFCTQPVVGLGATVQRGGRLIEGRTPVIQLL